MLLNNFSVQAGQHVTRIALCGVVVVTGTRPRAGGKMRFWFASLHLCTSL
jgi:hypothetical protein